MTNITKRLAAACGYENVTPEVRRFQSSASNGLVLDAKADIERLRAGYEAIKKATTEGRVCDDVAWFDTITTLYDFCDEMLCHEQKG